MFFRPVDTQFYIEKPRYLLHIPNVLMDALFHNSMNNLLVLFLFFNDKSDSFCLEISKICPKLLMIWDTSSDWLFFRHWRHLWGAFRPFYGPFGPHPGLLWTLLGSSWPLVDPPRLLPELWGTSAWHRIFASISRTSYSGRLPPYKGEAAKPPGPY